jgi:hypothetical protein
MLQYKLGQLIFFSRGAYPRFMVHSWRVHFAENGAVEDAVSHYAHFFLRPHCLSCKYGSNRPHITILPAFFPVGIWNTYLLVYIQIQISTA